MKIKFFFYSLIVIILVLVVVFFVYKFNSKSIIGNQSILDEVNRLLIPLQNGNITSSDFNNLAGLVKSDSYASSEVHELIVLAEYNETSHIGHGLGFLYDYVKTGIQPVCPGHSLSHYYVFLNHGESQLASDNLLDAKSHMEEWQTLEEAKNSSYLEQVNYTYYKSLLNQTITSIDSGNSTSSDDLISILSDAPCAVF
jgi:hypothetical protein